jgi:hypothetical protein
MGDEAGRLVGTVGCTGRTARRRRRQLVRELAEYRTAAERRDLLAAVRRCSSPACDEVRDLITATALHTALDDAPIHLRH